MRQPQTSLNSTGTSSCDIGSGPGSVTTVVASASAQATLTTKAVSTLVSPGIALSDAATLDKSVIDFIDFPTPIKPCPKVNRELWP